MKKIPAVITLLMAPVLCAAGPETGSSESESSNICDYMATLSARAVQAKDKGVGFVDFMDKVDEVDAPDDIKVALKYFVADAYTNGITPERAYLNTFNECLAARKGK